MNIQKQAAFYTRDTWNLINVHYDYFTLRCLVHFWLFFQFFCLPQPASPPQASSVLTFPSGLWSFWTLLFCFWSHFSEIFCALYFSSTSNQPALLSKNYCNGIGNGAEMKAFPHQNNKLPWFLLEVSNLFEWRLLIVEYESNQFPEVIVLTTLFRFILILGEFMLLFNFAGSPTKHQ